jgi:ubiquitin-conjugating enzyme E2 A
MLRLQSDLRQICTDPPDGCSASPSSDSDMFVWAASIFGPADTPWEGGVFSLRLTFSEGYPNRPPKVRFTGPMFHPNVYSDGTLCLDLIQDQWSPVQSVSTLLTSVQSLLTDPNCSSPANAEAARLFTADRREYNRRVKRVAARSIEDAWS